MNFNMKLLILLLQLVPSLCGEISFSVNPNCSSICNKPWIIHGTGATSQSNFHLLWNAVPLPTFIMAKANSSSTVSIDWDKLLKMEEESISFDPQPLYLFGISFQNIILYDDKNDTANLSAISPEDIQTAPLSDFEWTLHEFKNESTGDWDISFNALSFRGEPFPNSTEFSFHVTTFASAGRSKHMPGLRTKPLSSQIKIVIKNLFINFKNNSLTSTDGDNDDPKVAPISGFDHPRWAIDAVILSKDYQDTSNETFHFTSQKSLDDEFSPGVFDVNSIFITSNSSEAKSFIQWRPISYLTPDDDVNFSTNPNLNTSLPPIDQVHLNLSSTSFIKVIFGEELEQCLGTQTNISFGKPKDGFYTKYNYTEWTLSFGAGKPPAESLSFLVMTIILVGLGLPLLCLIGGITAAFVIQRRKKKYVLLQES